MRFFGRRRFVSSWRNCRLFVRAAIGPVREAASMDCPTPTTFSSINPRRVSEEASTAQARRAWQVELHVLPGRQGLALCTARCSRPDGQQEEILANSHSDEVLRGDSVNGAPVGKVDIFLISPGCRASARMSSPTSSTRKLSCERAGYRDRSWELSHDLLGTGLSRCEPGASARSDCLLTPRFPLSS